MAVILLRRPCGLCAVKPLVVRVHKAAGACGISGIGDQLLIMIVPVHRLTAAWPPTEHFRARSRRCFEDLLPWTTGVQPVSALRVSPALLYEIQLAVKFRKEENVNAASSAGRLE